MTTRCYQCGALMDESLDVANKIEEIISHRHSHFVAQSGAPVPQNDAKLSDDEKLMAWDAYCAEYRPDNSDLMGGIIAAVEAVLSHRAGEAK